MSVSLTIHESKISKPRNNRVIYKRPEGQEIEVTGWDNLYRRNYEQKAILSINGEIWLDKGDMFIHIGWKK